MKSKAYSLLILCVLGLSACQTWKGLEEDFSSIQSDFSSSSSTSYASSDSASLLSPCPRVEVVEDLAVLNDFENISKPSPDSLVSSVKLSKLQSTCGEKARSITVDLKLAFEGQLGPRGRINANDMPFFSYPYFVAVTAPSGEIMAKEVFAASITYNRGESSHTHYETLRHIIPLDDTGRAGRYKVLVGFQLGQEQLAWNREQLRLAKQAEREAEKARKAAEAKAAAATMPAAGNAAPTMIVEPNQPANVSVTPAPANPGPIDITSPR